MMNVSFIHFLLIINFDLYHFVIDITCIFHLLVFCFIYFIFWFLLFFLEGGGGGLINIHFVLNLYNMYTLSPIFFILRFFFLTNSNSLLYSSLKTK